MTNSPLVPELVAQIPVPVPHYRPRAILASAPVVPPRNLAAERDEVLARARQLRSTVLMNPSGQSSQQLFEIDQTIREVSSAPSVAPTRPGMPERPEVVALRETLDRAQELMRELASHPTLKQ
jgi:hypothetical protein